MALASQRHALRRRLGVVAQVTAGARIQDQRHSAMPFIEGATNCRPLERVDAPSATHRKRQCRTLCVSDEAACGFAGVEERSRAQPAMPATSPSAACVARLRADRKTTRLNSSHTVISYAVVCLNKNTASRAPAPPWR